MVQLTLNIDLESIARIASYVLSAMYAYLQIKKLQNSHDCKNCNHD